MKSICKTEIPVRSTLFVLSRNAPCCCLFLSLIFADLSHAQNVSDPGSPRATASERVIATDTATDVATDVAKPTALDRLSDWLLRSSQERRQQLVKESRFDELAERSGNDQWRAAGQYRRGEYDAAAEAYSTSSSANAAYNQATALAHTGDYDKALELLDDVLAERPADEDALHNRDIIEQLKNLAEQQQQSQSGESGDEQQESQDNGDGEDKSEQSQEQSDQSDDASSEENQQDSSEQQSSDESANADEADGDSVEPESDSAENADLEQMRRDAENAGEPDSQEDLQQLQEQVQQELAAREEPLTEEQQATEQWLRQIPDDPSGLLRRKLQQSHRNDYPSVQDLREPW